MASKGKSMAWFLQSFLDRRNNWLAAQHMKEVSTRLRNYDFSSRPEMLSRVLYRDASGAVKRTGEEPFSDFMKTAKRLTILTDSGGKDIRSFQDFSLGGMTGSAEKWDELYYFEGASMGIPLLERLYLVPNYFFFSFFTLYPQA